MICIFPATSTVRSCNAGWHDRNSTYDHERDCDTYLREGWCEGDAYGPNWKKEWGTFEDLADADGNTALVCPQCGCGQGKLFSYNLS